MIFKLALYFAGGVLVSLALVAVLLTLLLLTASWGDVGMYG